MPDTNHNAMYAFGAICVLATSPANVAHLFIKACLDSWVFISKMCRMWRNGNISAAFRSLDAFVFDWGAMSLCPSVLFYWFVEWTVVFGLNSSLDFSFNFRSWVGIYHDKFNESSSPSSTSRYKCSPALPPTCAWTASTFPLSNISRSGSKYVTKTFYCYLDF